MPKLMIYSNESPAYLRTDRGDEFRENSQELKDYLAGCGFEDTGHENDKWLRRAVKLGWAKGNYAEIGIAAFDPSREMAVDGVFMTYDRAGLNDLINGLRKMRDSAFGKDA